MTTDHRAGTPAGVRQRVLLLVGQTLSLGTLLAFVMVPSNAVFLSAYGSDALAYTYLGMAVLGTPGSMLQAAALRRWRQTAVSIATLAVYAAVIVGSWIAVRSGAAWASGLLLMVFVLMIQAGFVIVGGQAGSLLDVRQIKAQFPRIVAGFVVGFVVGGLLSPALLAVLPAIEDLLVLAGAVTAVFAGLVLVTGRRFAAELAFVPHPPGVVRVPLRRLLASRYVVAIVVYQVFSAVVSQLLDFMVMDRAVARYPDPDDLARVLSWYTVALNAIDLVVLVLFAGAMMRRWGLRFGVASNPVGDLGIVALVAVAAVATGPLALVLFLVVCLARITDLTVTDAMTRTSINAMYQVLPDNERLAVQAAVEGAGVPLAVGLSGVLLLVFDALGWGFGAVVVTSAVLSAAWVVSGVGVVRGYAGQLIAALRRRVIDPATLTVDANTLERIDELLAADRSVDVRLGIGTLAAAGHPALPARLHGLASHHDAEVRLAVVDLARTPDGPLRPDEAERLAALLAADPDATVAAAALDVLRGSAGSPATDAGTAFLGRADSPDPAERRAVAWAIATSPTARPGDRDLAIGLCDDPDGSVRAAALLAAGRHPDPATLAVVLRGLADPATASAAAAAVPAFGAALCGPLGDALDAARLDPPGAAVPRLVRACAGVAETVGVLAGSLNHPDRDVVLAVVHALARRPHRSPDPALDASLDAVATAASAHASACYDAIDRLDGLEPEATASLVSALRNEIVLAREVIVAALAARHDEVSFTRAGAVLQGRLAGDRALALEMLEVNLDTTTRDAVLPLLRDDLDEPARARLLRRHHGGDHAATDGAAIDTLLTELLHDPAGTWRRPWLRVSAAHAAGAAGLVALRPALETAAAAPDPDLASTAAWAAARLSPVS